MAAIFFLGPKAALFDRYLIPPFQIGLSTQLRSLRLIY